MKRKRAWNKIGSILKNWVFLCRFSWGISKEIFFTEGLYVILDTLEPFAVLIIPKFIIDELAGGRQWDRVLYYVFLLIVVLTVFRVVRLCLQAFRNSMVNQADVKNGMHYAGHFLGIDYAKLEDGSIRDFQQKISGNVHAGAIATECVTENLKDIFCLAGYGYLICSLHPMVLAMVFGVAAVNCFLGRAREKNRYEIQPQLAAQTRKFDYLFRAMSHFEFAKEVRINRAAEWLAAKFSEVVDSHTGMYIKFQNKQFCIRILELAAGFVQMAFLYGYAAWEAAQGHISPGDFTVYAGAVMGFSKAFAGAAERLPRMAFLSRYADEYKEYRKLARPSCTGTGAMPEEQGSSVIELRDVSFHYPNSDRMVLDHISLTITRGEKLGIVGINGAGKTTLIKLLCRLYEPTEGAIFCNGVDISAIRREEYLSRIAVVFQDFKLFAFSMEENIVLNRSCDKGRVLEAVSKSGLSDKLKRLPKGLDTAVNKEFDEEGIEFSGGEGQKLATARAYYKDAPIVILDEPTAALDPVSEQQVYNRFCEIMKDKTAVFISHRLASARFCSKVAVFERGRIAEYGTHEELLAAKGLYCEMFQKQAEYYREQT